MVNINKQWSDIWIEDDGIHMLKMACDRLFKENKPDYIADDYIIKFENVKKLKRLDYKDKNVMLVKLKDSSVEFEVRVNTFDQYVALKKKALFKTVGTKRKALLAACFVGLFCILVQINYVDIANKIAKSAKNVNLQRAKIEYTVKK